MSLNINLTAPFEMVVQPEVKKTINTLSIERIIDFPSQRKVVVFVEGERVELDALSGDSYDTPSEWTNADVVTAVKAHFGIA